MEGPGSLPGPAVPGHHLRRPWQWPKRPPDRRRGLQLESHRGRRGAGARRDVNGHCGRRRDLDGVGLPARTRRRSSRAPHRCGLHRAHCGARRSLARPAGLQLRRRTRHRRGLGQVQRAVLAARLARVRGLLHVAAGVRTALDETDRGLSRLGTGDDARGDDRVETCTVPRGRRSRTRCPHQVSQPGGPRHRRPHHRRECWQEIGRAPRL